MENSGWSDGQGLGKAGQGRPDVVNNQGQQGRFGLGYNARKGEKIAFFSRNQRRKVEDNEEDNEERIRISTIYDDKT